MLLHEVSTVSPAGRIADLLSQELFAAVELNEFGIIVQDVTPLDRERLILILAKSKALRSKKLRVSVVGYEQLVSTSIKDDPSLENFLAFDEQHAVSWRNLQLRTTVVIAERPLEKAATFRDFRIIDDRTLARRLCAEQRDRAEVNWLRSLWDALDRSTGVGLVLENIVRFADALDHLPAANRSTSAPKLLPVLGLFADSYLADKIGKSDQRLERRLRSNRDLTSQVRRATDEDWARMRTYSRSLAGTAKTDANRLIRQLREIGSNGPLGSVEYSKIHELWLGRPGILTSSRGKRDGIERCEVEQAVGKMLMDGQDALLADVSQEIRQVVKAALDDDSRKSVQDIKKASGADVISTVNLNRDLLELIRTRSTADDWGGVIDIAADKPLAMTEISAFKGWTPFRVEPIIDELKKFVDSGIAPEAILLCLDKFIELRSSLMTIACELGVSPIATFGGDEGLLTVAESYVNTYESLLRQVNAAYPEMHAEADFEAESILARILALEVYVYRREQHVEAVMSPLHPLFLWRSISIVREVRGLGSSLSKHEAHTLELACAEDLQFLQVLVLPPQVTGGDQPIMLGQAGFLGRLPIFREAPRGMLEPDGVKTVAELAQRLSKMRPFVRPGLQVTLVNLPRPVRFIEALLDRLQLEDTAAEDTYWGIHIRIRYTDSDTRGWANEMNEISDELRERLSAGEERGLLSISIHEDLIEWPDLVSELNERPTHLLVIVDPFHVRSSPVARAQAHGLSPWMPSCEYKYNPIREEITVIPVAEEHVFGSYLASASLVHPALQRKTPAHLPQVSKIKQVLDELAKSSTWTVIADPHRVPIARLGNAEVIDRRLDGARQLTSFAADLSPFIRRLDAQLRRTHFQADRPTLERLARELVAMEPNGILSLASSNHDKQVKGLLGKLIAARWYRVQQPSGLAVSLDTENARRWLVAGSHSLEKADLLGLREQDGTVVIDVIEVKAHDEAIPYTVSGGVISGKPVAQVLATMQALAEVFSPGVMSPLSKPRREVLREHLYTTLLRDQQVAHLKRWHSLLEEVFAGTLPVRLAGRIIHVRLASVASKQSQVYVTAQDVPIRVDTLSAEDVGFVLRSAKVAEPDLALHDGLSPDTVPETLEPATALKQLTDAPDFHNDARHISSEELADSEPIMGGQTLGSTTVVLGPTSIDDTETVAAITLKVKLGTEYSSSNEVSWQPGRQSNGFLLILGASGSGKTESLKVLGASIAASGVPVLVFDFHGDVVFPGLQSVLMSSGSASTLGLNPMELDVHSAEESGLYDQRASVRAMISRAVPALGHRQQSILKEAFDEVYRNAGIRDTDATTWNNPAPTFRDVQVLLEQWAENDDRKTQRSAIEGCLAAVQELFGHPIFQRERHVSVDEMLRSALRLDLSKLPDHVRFIATETLLRKIFRTLRLYGPIPVVPVDDRERFRLFVIIDEAKILSMGGADRDRSSNILNELVTEARKFGLGMILASQMSEHFSEEVRANAATWLVLKPMDIREAKKNAPNVSVDPEELIHLSGKGDGYYRDRPSSRARRVQIRRLE